MLNAHFENMEDKLIADSKLVHIAGHNLHKGTPRELFIRDFLIQHIPENISISSGEIIDSESRPGSKRNQFDIILYKNNYPKLNFAENINCFLVESVVATIEVKSKLDKKGLEQSIVAAHNVKNLHPNFSGGFCSGYIPPKILNFVIAYDGPDDMETIYKQINSIHEEKNIQIPNLSSDSDRRFSTPSPSIDGVFILKKGFLYFDNTPIQINSSDYEQHKDIIKWIYSNGEYGSLFMLFLFIVNACQNISSIHIDMGSYLKNKKITLNWRI